MSNYFMQLHVLKFPVHLNVLKQNANKILYFFLFSFFKYTGVLWGFFVCLSFLIWKKKGKTLKCWKTLIGWFMLPLPMYYYQPLVDTHHNLFSSMLIFGLYYSWIMSLWLSRWSENKEQSTRTWKAQNNWAGDIIQMSQKFQFGKDPVYKHTSSNSVKSLHWGKLMAQEGEMRTPKKYVWVFFQNLAIGIWR